MREFSPPQTCHVSRVTCHMSHVTCHMSQFLIFFLQSCETFRWRVCYQRGLPCLVYTDFTNIILFWIPGSSFHFNIVEWIGARLCHLIPTQSPLVVRWLHNKGHDTICTHRDFQRLLYARFCDTQTICHSPSWATSMVF